MYVKLTYQEFEYLMANCKFIKETHICFRNKNFIKISSDVKISNSIREWALDELEIKGFDENYELNSEGKILQSLVDLFYV